MKPFILNIDRCGDSTSNNFYQYSIEVYGKIVDKWISRETKHKYPDESKQAEYSKELLWFSIASSLFIYESTIDKGTAFITKEDIQILFKEHKTAKSTFSDLSFGNIDEFALTGRSLLTRDKEGNWSFSHKSIYEFFLAYLIYYNFENLFPKIDFSTIDMCEHFLEEFCLKYSTIPFFTGLKNKDAYKNNPILALTPQEVDIPNLNIWLLQDIEYIHDSNRGEKRFYLNHVEVYDYRIFLPLKKLSYSFLCNLADAYSKEKLPLATKLYERAVKKDQNKSDAYEKLYEYYNRLKKYDLALENLLLAKQHHDSHDYRDYKEYGRKLGILYFNIGDKAKALSSIKDYHKKSWSIHIDKFYYQYRNYVNDLMDINEFKVALETALEAHNKYKEESTARLVGHVYKKECDYKNALKFYKLALEFNNKDLFYHKEIGDCYLALNEKDKAIESYRQPTVIEPNDETHWYWLGEFYYKLKMEDKALECYVKPTTFEKANSRTWKKLAEFYSEIGKLNLALEACIKSTEFDNLSYYDWCELGHLYRMKLKKYTQAKECYEKSIELEPSCADGWNGLGNVYLYLENNEKAIDCYLKAIEYTEAADSIVSIYHSNLASSYIDTKDYDKAYKAAKEALTLNEKNAAACNCLGRIFLSLDSQISINYFTKAHSFEPDNLVYCCNLSVGYFTIDKFDEALDFCNKALKIDPHYESAQKLLKEIQEEIAKKDSEVLQPPNSKTE
jgi:tetratricopeptide (TPR) repeat protein